MVKSRHHEYKKLYDVVYEVNRQAKRIQLDIEKDMKTADRLKRSAKTSAGRLSASSENRILHNEYIRATIAFKLLPALLAALVYPLNTTKYD